MKRSLLIGLRFVVVVTIFVMMISLVVSTPPAVAKTITLKAVSFLPKHITAIAGMKMFVDRVNQQSKGEIKIKWLGGPEVMPPPAQIEAVRTGRIDMVIHSPERFVDKVPEAGCMQLSELNPMEERQSGAYAWITKYLKEKLNVHNLGRGNTGSGFMLYTSFPVSKIGDFSGKQIAARPQCFPFFKAMGAVPVNVGKGDWYSAVERGIVDAYSIPITSVVAWGLLDITKYTVDHFFYEAGNILLMANLDKWNKLPEKHRQLLNKIAKELEPDLLDFQLDQRAKAHAKVKKGGVKFVKLPPADAKKFLKLSTNAPWEVYKKLVGPAIYTKARKLFSK